MNTWDSFESKSLKELSTKIDTLGSTKESYKKKSIAHKPFHMTLAYFPLVTPSEILIYFSLTHIDNYPHEFIAFFEIYSTQIAKYLNENGCPYGSAEKCFLKFRLYGIWGSVHTWTSPVAFKKVWLKSLE